ncbi:MAG: GDP-mannose 4,6-dehydratase, partial [Planctomycetota bacterium]
MKYLITGISGFAGPHLARLLLENRHEVYGLMRASNGRESDLLDVLTQDELASIRWVYGDLLDYTAMQNIFKKTELDGVFHLAAQSHPPTSFAQPVLTFNINVMGTVNLIDCIEKQQGHNCRLHFCSTSEIYGDQEGTLTETSLIRPVNPYAASKAAMDLYVQERIRNGLINGFIT